jgi:hypothetical protein
MVSNLERKEEIWLQHRILCTQIMKGSLLTVQNYKWDYTSILVSLKEISI